MATVKKKHPIRKRKLGRDGFPPMAWRVILGVAVAAACIFFYSRVAVLPNLVPDQMLKRVITQEVPGLGQAVGSDYFKDEEMYLDQHKAEPVSRFRDPHNIFAAQIPYLSEVSSVIDYAQAEGVPDDRRIVIPVQTKRSGSGGEIIIYHTHTTESFVPTSGKAFTTDLKQTVAALGEHLASLLNEEHNIAVVHDKTIHDLNRAVSYKEALPTIKGLVEDYPDSYLVIDLHRDGVARDITTASLNGEEVGKILFVVGTRSPGWQTNYQVAHYLHTVLEEIAPGISRGVRKRPLVYNQHVHEKSLLVEVGGHRNSQEEALRSLEYLATALSRYYYQ